LFTLTHNECHNTPLHGDDSVMLLQLTLFQAFRGFCIRICLTVGLWLSVCACVWCAFVVLRVSDADLHCGAGDRHFCIHLQSPGLTT